MELVYRQSSQPIEIDRALTPSLFCSLFLHCRMTDIFLLYYSFEISFGAALVLIAVVCLALTLLAVAWHWK